MALVLAVALLALVVWWAGKAVLEGAREGIQEANEELAQEKAAEDAQQAQALAGRREAAAAAAQALTDTERFALNLRAPFTHVWLDIYADYDDEKRPLEYFYRLTPPDKHLKDQRETLESGWDVTDHASALSSMAWLLGGGHRSPYAEVRQLTLEGHSPPELKRELGVVRQWEAQVGESGGLAFDLARAADVAAQAFALGYVSEKECWRILSQCRQMALDTFAGWEGYGLSFQAGAMFWQSGGIAAGIRRKEYAGAVAWLLVGA